MPRAGLTTDLVVAEAADVVDEVGREGLTLAEVAKRFAVAQPSLYKHVDGLGGLHRLLAVKVSREVADVLRRAATGRAGADALRAVAAAYRAFAHEHPGRYAYLVRAPAVDDEEHQTAAADILAVLDDIFAGYGVTDDRAVDVARFVRSVLHGFVSLELGGGFGMPRSADDSFDAIVAATDRALRAW